MIKIIVEGPRARGKSYFIKHFLMPAVRLASNYFPLGMEGFTVIERCTSEDRGEVHHKGKGSGVTELSDLFRGY